MEIMHTLRKHHGKLALLYTMGENDKDGTNIPKCKQEDKIQPHLLPPRGAQLVQYCKWQQKDEEVRRNVDS